jgi:hypothetical protein
MEISQFINQSNELLNNTNVSVVGEYGFIKTWEEKLEDSVGKILMVIDNEILEISESSKEYIDNNIMFSEVHYELHYEELVIESNEIVADEITIIVRKGSLKDSTLCSIKTSDKIKLDKHVLDDVVIFEFYKTI